MKHSDQTSGKIRLTVDAHDPMVEIYVIDGRFKLAARGVGLLKENLPPGIYKVKFKAGAVIKEVDAILEPGKGPVTVDPPELKISTSAPLENTRTARDEHLGSAYALSQEIHETTGSAAQLFVYIRDLEEKVHTDPSRGLSLRSLSGKEIINFGESGKRSQDEQWAGCNVQLDPGLYRLRVEKRASGMLEQTVAVCEGWQTQVFLLRRNYGTTRLRARYADLANASILMAPLGQGFIPDRPDLRWTETARLGLSEGHTIIPSTVLNEMLWAKYENPMLGIFGAHLLLGTHNPDLDLLEDVLHNLTNLIGPHPDVIALQLRLAQLQNHPVEMVSPFGAPPMLRNSWDYVLEASASHPDLVPPNSLAARISPNLWGSGTWLVWTSQAAQKSLPAEKSTAAGRPSGKQKAASKRSSSQNRSYKKPKPSSLPGSQELNAVLPELRTMLSEADSFESIVQDNDLNEMEQSLLRYMSYLAVPPRTKGLQTSEDESNQSGGLGDRAEADMLSDQSLIQALGVPNLTARQTAASLIEKLKLRSGQ